MKFRITGEMKAGAGIRKFTKEVEAKSENHAKELIYALLGSQNGLKRTNVKIAGIAKVQ